MDSMEVITDEQRVRCEAAMQTLRRVSRTIRAEQDRTCDMIEQLIYEAKGREAVDMLVRLAQHILAERK